MAQDSEPELTAEVVAKRFADSADALAELHDQLMTLATAEENATTAASDINQVVVAAREFVVAAAALVDETKAAQALALEAFAASAAFLSDANTDSLKVVIKNSSKATDARLKAIEASLGDVQLRDARIVELEAELARRTARLPGRVKRQLGVEE